MKRLIIYALSLALIFALLSAFVSCAPATPSCPPHIDDDCDGACDICDRELDPMSPDPDLSGITFTGDSVVYDGESHALSISGDLPDGVTVIYTGNDKVDVGTYTVSARFYHDGAEIVDSTLTATLTITKATYDMSGVYLLSTTKTYDGIEVKPCLVGTLPNGVSASFTIKNSLGNTVDKMVDADVYTVYATFTSENANYYPIDPISATVRIEAPRVEGVRFEDATVTYDGAPHTILITGNLPTGVRVEYDGADKTAVGEYEITAKFYLGDVELVEDRLTATLTINKATIDMSGVSATDATAVYNGMAHTPTLSGNLPIGVEAKYTYFDAMANEVDEIVDAGVYRVVIEFIYDMASYNTIAPMAFTYTVNKAELNSDKLKPASLGKAYDGIAVKPRIVGDIPDGVEISYTYTDVVGNVIPEIVNVGEYTVVANILFDEDNFDTIEPITFVYTITKGTYDISGVSLSSLRKTYDGKAVELSLGSLPSGLNATITIKNSLDQTVEQMLNAGTYSVSVTFAGDYDNYYPVNSMNATVVIEKAVLGGITFTDAVFSYNGKEKSIYVVGAPAWLEVTYDANGVINPGTYTVTAVFVENENYFPIAPMTAKIIIEIDKNTPTEGILFEEYQDGYAVTGANAGTTVIIIPETYNSKPVLSIKSFAFDGNADLSYVYIPSSVVNVGNRAFSNCVSLSKIEFGNIKVIGQGAFKNTAIKEIALPDSLESIGYGAFEGTRLEKITLPFIGGSRHSSNAFIGFIFGGSTYSANAMKVPTTLTTVVLSNGCTTIPSRAFYGMYALTEVLLGYSVNEIGNSAFQGCSSLRSIYIPASVTAIPADAKPENGPFFGTANDMMVVVESIECARAWGQYFAHIGESKSAIVVYEKTFEDYVMNKDSYREVDLTDAGLSALFVGGTSLAGFAPDVYDYTVDSDIVTALPEIMAIASTSGARIIIVPASVSNSNIATITVTSINGENTLVYKIKFNLSGTFNTSAEVVNKDGAKGTVTFVVDDGYKPTASFMKTMMQKYTKLAVTYAISTKNLLTTSEEYTTDNGLIVDDIDNDGMKEYILDESGNYTYVKNEEAIDFWRDIISVGRSEIVAHSHTHAFWGVNDEGGAQLTASTADKLATRIYSSLAEGSATKEVYASVQIIKELFGDVCKGLTYVNAGIPPKEGDTTVTEEVRVYVSKQTVRVLNDTRVSITDGKIYLDELTWVDLQSTVGTIPSGTDIKTTADTSSGIIPACTAIYLASDYITIPTTDNNGNQNVVKGFKEYIKEIYAKAYADGIIIGGRTSGQKVYVASDFLNLENRLLRKAYIITTSTNEARPDAWKKHIDNAIAANGGWASFCIHAMTEDISEEDQGKHRITWAQAEDLFSYACGKGDDLWIASQTDATMYYHQWSTSTVTTSYDATAGRISISLTDEENDELYTMPLTIKVSVPGNWASATVNGEELTIHSNNDGTCYVYVDVAPETTVSVAGG